MNRTNFREIVSTAAVLLAAVVWSAAQPYGAQDPWMGTFEGEWQSPKGQGEFTSQIRPLGDKGYDGFVLLKQKGELLAVIKLKSTNTPAAGVELGFTGASEQGKNESKHSVQLDGKLSGKDRKSLNFSASLKGDLGDGNLNGAIQVKKSPTLGAPPPKDAVVLFDGKQTNLWENFRFLLNNDGSMQVQDGNLESKEKARSFQLHLEFRTPFMPTGEGQARGNSGVYLQSIYEVQVLDSFGLYPLQINDCSSIYGVKKAQGNACLPPMEWQTYDITYLHGSGTEANPPMITVVHNGETVIDRAKVPTDKIGKGGGGGNPKGGVLMLQDHGNPVQYRNIWLVKLDQPKP
jgi:hypothetical protein